MTTTTTHDTPIDVREIAPRERHPLVFSRFDALQPGQSLQLVNDHDPRPLRYQLEERCPGQVEWTYLQAGPDIFHVRIAKREVAAPARDNCCSGGACCG